MRTVAVIGPGRVGTALALALERAGYRIVAVAGRSRDGVEAFLDRLPDARPRSAVDATRGVDLVLVSVPDGAVETVVRTVARDDGVAEGSRWIHVSPSLGTDVLRPARLAGAAVAACHPAQTFPDPDTGLAALPGTSWAVTASRSDYGWAAGLVTDLRGSPVAVPGRSRALYHAGVSMGSNATTAVVTLARDLLLGAGISDPAVFLTPLATASATNAARHGAEALTGPVRRGDAGTVAAHLDELRAALPEAVDAYVALARLAVAHARRAGLDKEGAAAVEAALDPVRRRPDGP